MACDYKTMVQHHILTLTTQGETSLSSYTLPLTSNLSTIAVTVLRTSGSLA